MREELRVKEEEEDGGGEKSRKERAVRSARKYLKTRTSIRLALSIQMILTI